MYGYMERNIVSGNYGAKDFNDSSDDEKNCVVWVINKDVNVVTPYTYDEAISLAGHGAYTVGLLVVCWLSLLAMCIDIFSFSTVVASSACDLHVEPWQSTVLLSMPYLGAIATAYPWGYISDTRGRRLSLMVAMWGSFLATSLSALSPSWIVLAVLKFISVSFSSCAQSATYTLIGECCSINVKRCYFFILTSALHLALPITTALGYVFLNISYSINLGFLTFTPWRLLIISLGLPLGISAACLHGFYESPKFLANVGEKGKALENLRRIWRRNRCVGKKYPVEKLVLQEEGNSKTRSKSLLQSLWEQTAPLFKMPLLIRTMQLYFLTMVLYSTTNSLLTWFPFLVDSFVSATTSLNVPEGMCKIIEFSQNLTDSHGSLSCAPNTNIIAVWASAAQGLALVIINISICKVINRKVVVIIMMAIVSASCVGCALIEDNAISLLLFFIIFLSVVVNGIVSSYFVDCFPTSYRGMAACLALMVARCSGLVGTSVTGLFIMSHCTNTFYVFAGNLLLGVLVACFLPSDRAKNQIR